MGRQDSTLIVIPTYNEAENIEAMISAIQALDAGFDLLIVDDNSPDGTGEIVEGLIKELPGIHILHRPGKLGLGTAYVAGFRWALERGYAHILEMDCDFSHHPRYLPTFLDQIGHADLVIGSRYVTGGGTANWSLLRKFISGGGNTFARMMLRLKTRDCTGGFRCYRREIIEQIPWEALQLQGYGFQVGAVYYAERMGAKVAEFPILFEDRRMGASKMSSHIVWEAFVFVLRTALLGPPHKHR
jgi:dolichol-phosphate mannosyltransferase